MERRGWEGVVGLRLGRGCISLPSVTILFTYYLYCIFFSICVCFIFFIFTFFALLCRHQPLTVQSLILVSLLPFEGQNQWLQLQQQLLQPASGVLTRAQRLLLLGYDENQRKEEELQRDTWLEQLAAAAGPEVTNALRRDIRIRLTKQRREDMVSSCTSAYAFLCACKQLLVYTYLYTSVHVSGRTGTYIYRRRNADRGSHCAKARG